MASTARDDCGKAGTEKPADLPRFLRRHSDGVTLAVKVQPRAARNEILAHDGTADELRIRVTAPPVDAAANEALVRFLSEQLDCPRSKIVLAHGHTSRHKLVKVYELDAAQVLSKLSRCK